MKISCEIIWLWNSCVTSKRIEITYLALCLYILVPWIWPSLSFNYACLIFLAVCTFETLTYKWELYSQNMYLHTSICTPNWLYVLCLSWNMSIKNSSKYLFYLSDIAMDWSDHAMWWPEKNIWLDNTRWTLDQYNITGYLLSEYKYSKSFNQNATGQ